MKNLNGHAEGEGKKPKGTAYIKGENGELKKAGDITKTISIKRSGRTICWYGGAMYGLW